MKSSILVNSKIFSKFFVMLPIIFLSACGGGGGGGSSSDGGKSPAEKNEFNLSLNPGQISSQCYENESCEVSVRATYQGTLPKGTVYVKATLDNSVQHFYYAINETYADLTFGLQHFLKKGNYTGQVSIDICADEGCIKRYGSRYTIPYTWKVMSDWPTFYIGVVGSNERTEAIDELPLSGVMGEPSPLFELKVEMPGSATSVSFPQEFIDLYKVKKITETVYQLQLPEGGASSKRYAFTFIGPGYSNVKAIAVGADMKRKMTPLPLQVVRAVFYETFDNARDVIVGNYADALCRQEVKKSLVLHNGNDWVKIANSGCGVSLTMGPSTNGYGFYEATLKIEAPSIEPFELPVVMAYSKRKLESRTLSIAITPNTDEEALSGARSFTVYSGDTTLLVSPVSAWIKEMTLTSSSEILHSYDYVIDVTELKKINPMNSGTGYWEGVIKVGNTNPNGDFGVGTIDLTIEVPFVYSIKTKSAPANMPFSQVITGDRLNDFSGVEIVTLGQDEQGEYTKAVSKVFYHPSGGYSWDARNSVLTYEMPEMEPGVYQLNFSGIFSDHFPRNIIKVE